MTLTTELLLVNLDERTKECYGSKSFERALYILLREHKEEIDGLIEEDQNGTWFHKSFRQTDTIDYKQGTLDVVIHKLLDSSKIFWKLLDDWQKEDRGVWMITDVNNKF